MADDRPVLTPMQQRFVEEYPKDLKRARAAIRAGCPPRSARQTAYDWWQKPEIRDAIRVALAERSARLAVDTDNVVLAALEIRERCMQRQPVMTRNGKEWVQATQDGEGVWQFDAKGANAANALLAKHVGGFIDRKEVALPPGAGVLAVPVPVDAAQWAGAAKAQQAALTARPDTSEPGT